MFSTIMIDPPPATAGDDIFFPMNPNLIQTLISIAQRQQTSLYLVGGPIRDALLNRPCHDWDFVCRHARKVALGVSRKLHATFITLDEQNRIYRVIVPSSGLRPSRHPHGCLDQGCPPLAHRQVGEGARRAGEGTVTLDFAELQGRTIEEDLARRDLTINAMAVKIVPGTIFENSTRYYFRDIVDPFGGRRDLKSGTIRAVSEKAFTEDPLRLLRAFRFAAQFQFKIEPKTLKWIKKQCAPLTQRPRRPRPLPSVRGEGGVRGVAFERIREEFLRLLRQSQAAAQLRAMDRCGLLPLIFPEIEACRRTAVRYYGKGGVLKHSFEAVENLEWLLNAVTPACRKPGPSGVDFKATGFPLTTAGMTSKLESYLSQPIGGYPRAAWLKWAAFLHDIGKPATAKVIKGRLRFLGHEHIGAALAMKVGQRLRCSRQEVQLLGLWVRNHMRLGNLAAAAHITDKAVSRFFRDLGEEGVGMVLVSLADHYTYLSKSLWGKGKDPVERMAGRLLSGYYEERAKILPPRLLNGHDLMRALKLKPGPLVGRLLEQIQDAQSEGKVKTKSGALVYAKKKL